MDVRSKHIFQMKRQKDLDIQKLYIQYKQTT